MGLKRSGKVSVQDSEPVVIPAKEEFQFHPKIEEYQGEKILIMDDEPEQPKEVIPEKIKERSKKVILTYFHQKGVLPPMGYVASKITYPKTKISHVFKDLEKDGFLTKKGTRYTLNFSGKEDFSTNALEKAKANIKMNPWMVLIKLVMLIVGIGATYMSIFHSRGFLADFYNGIKPLMAAIIMIVFNVLAAEMVVFFHQKGQEFLRNCFTILWVLGTLFSMGSTVLGMYNARAAELTAYVQEENVTTREDFNISLTLKNLLSQQSQADASLTSERSKRDDIQRSIAAYTPDMIEADRDYFNKLNGRRYIADTRVDDAQNAYDNITDEITLFLSKNDVIQEEVIVRPPDAYSWIAGIISSSTRPEMVQFWMSVYPAVFYDIIAPVSLSIVFFLPWDLKKKTTVRKKKRKKHARRNNRSDKNTN